MEETTMKSLFEQNDGTYRKQGDYLIPYLTLLESDENSIGVCGQRHLNYLQEHRKLTYINLLTSGKLNAYLADIDNQAQERFELLVTQMKNAQCITEQLKADNPMEWVGRMNCIRQQVEELILRELICR